MKNVGQDRRVREKKKKNMGGAVTWEKQARRSIYRKQKARNRAFSIEFEGE